MIDAAISGLTKTSLYLLLLISATACVGENSQPTWPAAAPNLESAVFSRAGITVKSIDQSLKLYRDLLGMVVIRDRKAMSDPRLSEFLGINSEQTIRLVILRMRSDSDFEINTGYIALAEISDADGNRVDPAPRLQTSGVEPGSIMLQFVVEDVLPIHAELVRMGYDIISAPVDKASKGFGELLVRDPNGIRMWITDRYQRSLVLPPNE